MDAGGRSPVSREAAARIASEYLSSGRGFVEGVGVGPVWDGAGEGDRMAIYQAGFRLERCWGVSVIRAPASQWALRSRDVILVSKDTGEVVYAGSANDEG